MYYFHNSFFIESVKNFNLYIKKRNQLPIKEQYYVDKKNPQNKQKNSAGVIVVHIELNQEL